MRFRRRPTFVEAQQFQGKDQRPVVPGVCLGDSECRHASRASKWHTEHGMGVSCSFGVPHVITKQGELVAIHAGEWIVKESDNSGYYPVHPDVFKETYDQIE